MLPEKPLPDHQHAASRNGSKCVLHQGDCLKVMADPDRVPPGSVDVVVTSPPYNLGIAYSTYDDGVPREEYLAWIGRWGELVLRALSEKGSLFLNVSGKPSDPNVPFEVLATLIDRGFRLQNTIHWVKSIAIARSQAGECAGISGDIVVGHYKPINSSRFLNDCHEYIFHLTRAGDVPLDRLAIGVPYQDKSNVRRWKSAGRDVHCRGNVWFIPYKTICNQALDRPHPATFPVELPEMCLRLHGLERISMVMDPFLGLGNTALACRDLGLDVIGIEVDAAYYDEAVRALGAKPRAR